MNDLIDQLWPIECPGLVRVGRAQDGGYVLPAAALAESDALLSFGLGDDWSFEADCVARRPGLRVDVYDPTVGPLRFFRRSLKAWFSPRYQRDLYASYRRLFDGRRGRHWREWVGSRPDDTGVLAAAARLLPEGGLLVKMDIEGAEYGVLSELVALSPRITALAIEFHDTDRRAAEIAGFARTLGATHPIVHLHGNNAAPLCADGRTPTVLELTFARRGLLPPDLRPFAGSLPRPDLDRPNLPDRPDCLLQRPS